MTVFSTFTGNPVSNLPDFVYWSLNRKYFLSTFFGVNYVAEKYIVKKTFACAIRAVDMSSSKVGPKGVSDFN